MIPVTKVFLPSQHDYNKLLERAWSKGWITNRGELVKELESKLVQKLGVNKMIAMTNGTLPLQIAIKCLGLKSEIITTPFSYVATTSSIVWENCTPVFVDIHPEYLTIDETKIEEAITENTTGILATHVFGNPCHLDKIEDIAKKYQLKVIYDAAHSFGTTYKGNSVFNYGDVSTCSFHATKVFHTGEGGAIFCNSEQLYKELFYHHNFGHDGPTAFHGLGINAKMSELNAAMGLAVLPHIDQILENREKIVQLYKKSINWNKYATFKIREGVEWNYSYFPLLFENEEELLKIVARMNEARIFPRRYFYPSLNNLPYVTSVKMPISESIAKRIVCLPLYFDLKEEECLKISKFLQ